MVIKFPFRLVKNDKFKMYNNNVASNVKSAPLRNNKEKKAIKYLIEWNLQREKTNNTKVDNITGVIIPKYKKSK